VLSYSPRRLSAAFFFYVPRGDDEGMFKHCL
jgi:hypothetical protein